MEITAHDHGSFCFAELNTPNAELGKRFYCALLGWGAVDLPINSHHYSLFQLHGSDVAGLRWDARTPHRWVPYVHVESVDRTAARARDLGATIVGATSGLPGNVRTCVLEDPEGAVIGLWETRGHQGARLVNEARTLWWFELLARNIASARGFYMRLFDWAVVETLKYGNGPYTIFKIGDSSVAGAVQFADDWGVTPRWQVYFAVNDYNEIVRRTESLGGALEFQRDVPETGRLGVLRDSARAVFVIMKPLVACID
jgi:predicted enzyme related to lactoylglutathione lyase